MAACSYCGHAQFREDAGYVVCTRCAAVNERMLTTQAEWRAYDAQDVHMNRVGAALDTLVPSDLQMHIELQGKCSSAEAFRSKQMHNWGRSSNKDRILLKAYKQIAQCAKEHDLPTNIINDAKALFRSAYAHNQVQRGRRVATMATCVYCACKKHGVPRSAQEVADMFGLQDSALIAKVSKRLDVDKLVASTPLDFIARFSSHVCASKETLELAMLIGKRVTDLDVVPSYVPPTVACACIAMACKATDLQVTMDALSRATRTSTSAIARCYKHLAKHVDRVLCVG